MSPRGCGAAEPTSWCHDPAALRNAAQAHPQLRYDDGLVGACRDADGVLLLTDWPEYSELDLVALATVVRHPRMLDARLALDPAKWRAAGRDVHALGR